MLAPIPYPVRRFVLITTDAARVRSSFANGTLDARTCELLQHCIGVPGALVQGMMQPVDQTTAYFGADRVRITPSGTLECRWADENETHQRAYKRARL